MSTSPSKLRLALFALACLALPTAGDVFVVKPTGGIGVDATTVQGAVDLAADGDTVLVYNGVYDPFTVDGKALDVIARGGNVILQFKTFGGAAVEFSEPTIVVRNLSGDQQVLLQGFRTNFGVLVEDCAGPVWFDQLIVQGAISNAQCTTTPVHGAEVRDSQNVTFTNSQLIGEDGSSSTWNPLAAGSGALVRGNSSARFYGCTIDGGPGSDVNWNGPAQDGGPGLHLDDGEVLIVGCTIVGGPGGLGAGPVCTGPHQLGGPGVLFDTGGGTLSSAASTAVGGFADLSSLCPGSNGPAGPAISGSGTILPLPGFFHDVTANNPIRGGNTLTFQVTGQPGEVPLLLLSSTHDPLDLPNLSGALLIGLPLVDTFVLPALDASGAGSLAIAVPNVGATVGAVSYYTQSCFLDPAGPIWLGGGTTVTLLDVSL